MGAIDRFHGHIHQTLSGQGCNNDVSPRSHNPSHKAQKTRPVKAVRLLSIPREACKWPLPGPVPLPFHWHVSLKLYRNGSLGVMASEGLRAAFTRPSYTHVELLVGNGDPEECGRTIGVVSNSRIAKSLSSRYSVVYCYMNHGIQLSAEAVEIRQGLGSQLDNRRRISGDD